MRLNWVMTFGNRNFMWQFHINLFNVKHSETIRFLEEIKQKGPSLNITITEA